MMARDVKILVLGQSNAAGFGTTAYTATSAVKELQIDSATGSRTYADPIQWGDHDVSPNYGSIWGRLGDLLVSNGICNTVSFEVAAVGSSSVQHWDILNSRSSTAVRGYLCAARLDQALNDHVWDAIIWQQGEQDTVEGLSVANYKNSMTNVINRIRTLSTAPIFITLSTYAFGQVGLLIRQAQIETVIAKQSSNVWLAFDMDQLVPASKRRSDDVHLGIEGLITCAQAWYWQLLGFLR